MLSSIAKQHSLSTQMISAMRRQAPRVAWASVHTSHARKMTDIAQADDDHVDSERHPAFYSQVARLGLQTLDPNVMRTAFTHKSVQDAQNNAVLEYLGKRVTGLFVAEYFHSKYPLMHENAFNKLMKAYVGSASMANIGQKVGLQHVVQWKRPQELDESKPLGQSTVIADCMNAIIGAIYQEQGPSAAKKFVHAHVLSRELDVRPLLKLKEPKRHLSALLKKLGKENAVSRLLSETGRQSSAPVFVVGVFSGEEKLGEGFGSSLKMAEYRACQDALVTYYGQESKDFILPSDADTVPKYTPPVLGNTEAIV